MYVCSEDLFLNQLFESNVNVHPEFVFSPLFIESKSVKLVNRKECDLLVKTYCVFRKYLKCKSYKL